MSSPERAARAVVWPLLSVLVSGGRVAHKMSIAAWRGRYLVEENRSLETGNEVSTGGGLVGRLVAAQGTRGVVVLLTDAEHAVAARVQRADGDHGIGYASPAGTTRRLALQMTKLPQNAVALVGDSIVTSGLGGRFPA